jgi:hypothetical protein
MADPQNALFEYPLAEFLRIFKTSPPLWLGFPSSGEHDHLGLRSRLKLCFLPDLPRDIESSVGFATMACSVGFATMDLAFSVGVSRTGNWFFPALGFYFSRHRDSGRAGY